MNYYTALLLVLFCSNLHARPWGKYDNPKKYSVTEYNFNNIPTAGRLDLNEDGAPWSGYHWPNKVNNIDYRPGNQKRSPLEKWEEADLYGDFFDIRRHIDSRNRGGSWGGYCHGYTATSLLYKEPTKKKIGDVTFYHSDVKALLAIYYDYLLSKKLTKTIQLGRRCYKENTDDFMPGQRKDWECEDLNPASFLLALNQKINNENVGIAMDMNSGVEVWNVPIIGYETKVIGESNISYRKKARKTKRLVELHTTLTYLGYQKPENDFEIPGEKGQKTKKVTYKYVLELDRNDKVIGGEWLEQKHPDMFWISGKLPEPTGKWAPLKDLIN